MRTAIACLAVAIACATATAAGLWAAQSPASPAPAGIDSTRDAIDDAMEAMYNQDFDEAQRVLDAHLKVDAKDPLGHSARAAALLFAEFDRLQILELDFFGSDDRLTGGPRLKPDPGVRQRLLASTGHARLLASQKLVTDANHRRALFAMGMAMGIEVQYATVVEHRYLQGGSQSARLQAVAQRMLALNPPIYDAYVTLGSIEYVVASLNPVYRLLARFIGLRGDKPQALAHLQIVAAQGRYYRPYAKLLLAVFHSREGRLPQARALLDELRKSFPRNRLFPREVARIDAKLR